MGVLRTFDQECLNAADNARRTLITILQDNADTAYGKKLILQISVLYLNTRNRFRFPPSKIMKTLSVK